MGTVYRRAMESLRTAEWAEGAFRSLVGRWFFSLEEEVLARPDLVIDSKADFHEKSNLEPLFKALKDMKIDCELKREEEHSAWMVTFRDPTQAERKIDTELASQPEYRRLRLLAKKTAKLNQPPFTVISGNDRDTLNTWRDLLDYVKSQGSREVNIQRYKGLGEMNAEQLWETTMDAERRTLLRVSLEDLVASDEIFTTLMGEDVESRRKFIEENALDVRNLDI